MWNTGFDRLPPTKGELHGRLQDQPAVGSPIAQLQGIPIAPLDENERFGRVGEHDVSLSQSGLWSDDLTALFEHLELVSDWDQIESLDSERVQLRERERFAQYAGRRTPSDRPGADRFRGSGSSSGAHNVEARGHQ